MFEKLSCLDEKLLISFTFYFEKQTSPSVALTFIIGKKWNCTEKYFTVPQSSLRFQLCRSITQLFLYSRFLTQKKRIKSERRERDGY